MVFLIIYGTLGILVGSLDAVIVYNIIKQRRKSKL